MTARRYIHQPRPLLALGCLILALVATGCAPQRGVEAMQLLGDITAGELPDDPAAADEPRREALHYEVDGRAHAGDVYHPVKGPQAALVLVPGLAPEGKDDPQLVALAYSLARAGFTVLVPELEGLRDLQVRTRHIRDVADAAAHLSADHDLAPGGHTGIAAVSYAAGPAVLAALEPDVRNDVDFVIAVGGYYDLENVVTFFTTGHFRAHDNGEWRHLEPHHQGKWMFIKGNAARVADDRDRELLMRIAERRLHRPYAHIGDLVAGLGSEGQAVHALVTNEDPERVAERIAALPPELAGQLRELSPAHRDLSKLQARLILVHGRIDDIIPYTESTALADAAPPDRSRLFLVDGLRHVQPEPGISDYMRLWRASYAVLSERDRRP